MSKTTEVLRLKYASGLSHRQIGLVTSLSKGAVGKYVSRAEAVGISAWPLPEGVDEATLEARLFPEPTETPQRFVEPDWFEGPRARARRVAAHRWRRCRERRARSR